MTGTYHPFLTALALFVVGCGSNPVRPPADLVLESEHFVVLSNTEHAAWSDLEEGVARAEDLYRQTAALVGAARMPAGKTRLLLEGSFQDRGPYVDILGVHLFRYSPGEGGYWALIAHELGHALRVDYYVRHETWTWPSYGFFDEGFAEFVAQRVDPAKTGFPFFGYPEDVVVGSLVARGQHIPPAVLRRQHTALNQPCEYQTYPQRASWMRYVEATYGLDTLLAIVYAPEEPTSAYVQRVTGVSLEGLDTAWEGWIRARYAAIPEAEAVARAYHDRTSWAHRCTAGVEY